MMARQLAQVATKYCDQPLVVINKPGGSGLLALANTYNSKADGFTLLAFPAAFLAPIQTTDIGFDLNDFYYLACLTISPEAILTNKHSEISSLQQILDNAKNNPGGQKWCGPGSGTLDHLMAVKIWDKAKIFAKWIPYAGGGPAVVAVMGRHSDVYVGNPEDILGREENLNIAAVASRNRLPAFPNTPTFSEFGIDLTNEVMWRGFAVKKGTPQPAIDYLENLLWQCSQDSLWQNFVKRIMVQPVFYRNETFTEMVQRDAESSRAYLDMAGFKIGSTPESAPKPVLVFAIVLILCLTGIVVYGKKAGKKITGTIVIAATGLGLAILFYYMSLYFPAPRVGTFVGASTVPQVWALFMATMAIILLLKHLKENQEPNRTSGQVKLVVTIILLITVYTLCIPLIGFFPATIFMLLTGMFVMQYRKYTAMIIVTAAVMIFMFVVFYKILLVPLPMGNLF